MVEPGGHAPTFHGPGPTDTPLAQALDERIDGVVRADEYTRHLYATDASLFRAVPVAVTFPTSRSDVVDIVDIASERDIPVLPRGAGTSLAGQTVNEAIVIDTRRALDSVSWVDTDRRQARVEPGVVVGELNDRLADDGLQFAPDPAWADKSTIGGAIGNNSSGAHSLAYGPTDEYLHEVEVVLADGTVATFGPTDRETIAERATPTGDLAGQLYALVDRWLADERETIADAAVALNRNVSGYNIASLLETDADGRVNMARLFAGSEGTLGIVTEATVRLAPVPEAVATMMLTYEDVLTAMADVAPLLDHEPAAIEALDDVLLEAARDHDAFADVAAIPPPDAEAVLLVECFGSDRSVAREAIETIRETFGPDGGTALSAHVAVDDAERERLWQLRKASLPLLLSRTTDEKHPAFVEDTVVPPEELPTFVDRFREVLSDHDTFASFYGHAGPGVLHVRPLIDTTDEQGRAAMRSIATSVFEVVRELDGSISGEHGDGRIRTEWVRDQYGSAVYALFEALKSTLDPAGLLNPGPITGSVTLDADHRVEPEDVAHTFETALRWDNDNGYRGMVDLCHGCGGCTGSQAVTGGIMCPTYRASEEEIASTRGRANLLREAMYGHLDPEVVFDPRFEAEVLDLCIGCKGCLRDCPSGVDLAKLKVELRHQRHRRRGSRWRERLFAAMPQLAAIGSATAPVSNWIASLPGMSTLAEHTVGISRSTAWPTFARTSFSSWAADHEPAIAPDDAVAKAVIVPDTYTDYMSPAVGRASVRLLEACGVHVQIADTVGPIGRTAYSQGFVDRARDRAQSVTNALRPYVEADWAIVVPEPSVAAMVQHDYGSLLEPAVVDPVAEATTGPLGLVASADLTAEVAPTAESFAFHAHCHQQSIGAAEPAIEALRSVGYDLAVVDSGCCGMAGSFGYEAEHVDMSRSIGAILVDQLEVIDPDTVLVPGVSCRSQLSDIAPSVTVEHPVIRVAGDLVGG